jgi:phosphatidylserine decarboxylase
VGGFVRQFIVKDGWPLIVGCLAVPALLAGGCTALGWHGVAVGLLMTGVALSALMTYFFRDPERVAPADPGALVAGADGLVRAVEVVREDQHLKADAVRVSIFLSPFDVHVNRSPMAGQIEFLDYTPGKHILTIQNAASEYNEHSSILIKGKASRCLVKQIVGPIVRRVVYWLTLGQPIGKGERIGMMKFGSRLDMYFPKSDAQVVVKKGDRVRAGETVVAILSKKGEKL